MATRRPIARRAPEPSRLGAARRRSDGSKQRRLLLELDRCKDDRSAEARDRKLEILSALGRARLSSLRIFERFHEVLCFLRAYPDDAELLAVVESLLEGYPLRPELRSFRGELVGSGIAGTPIDYRFFYPTAAWLAARWPGSLSIDWRAFEDTGLLEGALPLLVGAAEASATKSSTGPIRRRVDLARGSETDGGFLASRLASLPADVFTRELLHDGLDLPYSFQWSPGSPSRTRAKWKDAELVFRSAPMARERPDLRRELARPPRGLRVLGPREAEALIDLAREAMVTRARDLDAFAYGSQRDVRVIDDGDGLQFACIGVEPERRLFLAASYGLLTLRNGVPVGYVELDVLFRCAEISFNTFETFRGGEAAFTFARLLSLARWILGAETFSIEPYQLGDHNTEAIESGAWWFYYKLGFRPEDPGVLQLAAQELAARKRRPGHRSDARTLEALARAHVYFDRRPLRPGVRPPPSVIERRLGHVLAERRREGRLSSGADTIAEASSLLELGRKPALSAHEKMWLARYAPMLVSMPELSRFSRSDRVRVREALLAKAAPKESEFLERFEVFPRLGRAIRRLAGEGV